MEQVFTVFLKALPTPSLFISIRPGEDFNKRFLLISFPPEEHSDELSEQGISRHAAGTTKPGRISPSIPLHLSH